MQRFFAIGNLTRDPELNQTATGITYCRFSIAVNRNYTNANGEREVDFFNVVTWRGQAENCSEFLRKGRKVGIVGSINVRNYEQDGVKKTSVEINADEVEFLTPKSSQGDTEEAKPSRRPMRESRQVYEEDLPF